jgi:hypothetical protein
MAKKVERYGGRMKFKVGDRVVTTEDDGEVSYGSAGTIIKVDHDDDMYLVQFDNWAAGHDGDEGDGTTDKRYMLEEELEHYRNTPKKSPVAIPVRDTALPTSAQERKDIPLMTGVIDYFTAALMEIAKVSKAGNDQHNPGQPLHWNRELSTDHADCIMRHLAERGTFDSDGQRHTAKVAWRALALLQTELEQAGAPVSRGSRHV